MTKTFNFRAGRFGAFLTLTTRLAIRRGAGEAAAYSPEGLGVVAAFSNGFGLWMVSANRHDLKLSGIVRR